MVGVIWVIISIDGGTSVSPPIIVGVSGCISSLLIYGFGEVIYHLKRIDNKLNGKPEPDKLESINEGEKSYAGDVLYDDIVSDEEIIAELEKDLEDESYL